MSVPEAGANKQDVLLIIPGLCLTVPGIVYDKFCYPAYFAFIYRAIQVYVVV